MASTDPGTVKPYGNVYIDAILSDDKWDTSITNISYGFTTVSGSSNPWSTPEMDAVGQALAAFSRVAGLTFELTASSTSADLEFYLVNTLPGNALGVGNGPEGRLVNGQTPDGNIFFSQPAHPDWLGLLAKGGNSFYTILHEIGHGLGLEHTHDTKDKSGLFPGVTSPSDTGQYGLNISLNTVMSYNLIGWGGPTVTNLDYGFAAGPMAFDIAALQYVYGKNMTTGTGNNVYFLPDANQTGTYYSCIWDAAGFDEIRYTGTVDCTIDLRMAPLTGKNAGGYLSSVDGILGGYTIAKGAAIEDATSGSGNDKITGNNLANILDGSFGNDDLNGLGGDDLLDGGFGFDTISGGSGNDTVTYAFYAASSGMVVDLLLGKTTFQGQSLFDTLVEIEHVIGGGGSDRILGTTGKNTLDGRLGDDTLIGRDGNDILIGGMGQDSLVGGGGADVFRLTQLSESSGGFVDDVTDFLVGTDRFDVNSENLAAGLARRSFESQSFNEIFTDIGTSSAHQMLLLTVTGSEAGTYLFINDSISAADWTKDALIELSGFSGRITINDFV